MLHAEIRSSPHSIISSAENKHNPKNSHKIMGSSQSSDQPPVVLRAQLPGVQIVLPGKSVDPAFVSLCIERASAWGSTVRVVDAKTKQHAYDFTYPALSKRCILRAASGHALANMTTEGLTSNFRVYEGEDPDTSMLDIRAEAFPRRLIYADFKDIGLGAWYEREVVMYMETGDITLPPKPTYAQLSDER